MLEAKNRHYLFWVLLVFNFWSSSYSAHDSDPVTCPSIYIEFHCIPFRFDGKSWTDARQTCLEYAIQQFSGANMAAIPTPSRQREMEKFLDRIIMSPTWIGGVENRFIWRWSKDNLDLLVQGCVHNLNSNFFLAKSEDNDVMTVAKCLDVCKQGSNGYAAINKANHCYCGDSLNESEISSASHCDFPCGTLNQMTCRGKSENYSTLFRIGGVGAKWGAGQPDNKSGREFCAVIDLNLLGGLADEDCDKRYPYLCQFFETNISCQTRGGRLISQTCYHLSDQSETVTWQEAGRLCRSIEAELVTLNSDPQQLTLRNLVAQTFRRPDAKVWVGAYIGGWRWLAANTFAYTNWAPEEPKTPWRSLSAPLTSPSPLMPNDTSDREMYCISMKQSTAGYQWYAQRCSTSPVFFLCQRGYDYYKSYAADVWSGPYPEYAMDPAWFSSPPGTTVAQRNTSTRDMSAPVRDLTDDTLRAGESLLPPENTVAKESLSKIQIAIIAFVVVLSILLVFLMTMCLVLCLCCRKRQKVTTIKELDARPVAHLPESGISHVTTSSTERLKDHDQLDQQT